MWLVGVDGIRSLGFATPLWRCPRVKPLPWKAALGTPLPFLIKDFEQIQPGDEGCGGALLQYPPVFSLLPFNSVLNTFYQLHQKKAPLEIFPFMLSLSEAQC